MQVHFVLLAVGSFQSQISQPRGNLLDWGTFLENHWMENWRTGSVAVGIELEGVALLQGLIGKQEKLFLV